MSVEMYVIKASGEKEELDVEKVRKTCLRAGASRELADKIAKEVEKRAYDGIATREVLNLTLKLLKEEPKAAIRYDLKRAIMSLGPTGFPFEKFVAGLLQNYGYKTKVGKVIRGKCVDHEIDIVAEKDDRRCMVECKYHNALGIYTDLKVALYTHARFLDLGDDFDQAWLVCNTKLTIAARKYAKCAGLKIMSWRYPREESLERMIEEKKLYPITILRSVKGFAKDRLFQVGIMLTKDLLNYGFERLKKMTDLPRDKLNKIMEEAKVVRY